MPARKTLATLVLIAFIFLVGANLQTGWVYLLTSFIISLILVSYFAGKSIAKKIKIERIAPDRAVAGQPVKVKYRISKAAPHFSVEEPAIGLSASAASRESLIEREIRLKRGVYKLNELKIKTSYPGGWFTFTKALHQSQLLIVWPEVDVVNLDLALSGGSGELAAPSRANRGLEYAGVREYSPGDSIRRIHWKRTARSGELFVRETISHSSAQFIVFLDNRCPESCDFELFEHQVSAAASLLSYLWRKDYKLTLAFFDKGKLVIREDSYERLMDILAGIEPDFNAARTNGTVDDIFEQSAEGAALIYILPQLGREHELVKKFKDVVAVCVGSAGGCVGARNISVAVEKGKRTWLL